MKTKSKTIKITTTQAIAHLTSYLQECDGDELARLLGDCFGGECFQNKNDSDIYDFEPNEYYCDEFSE